MSEDARTLIAKAAHDVLEEVPALKPLKLVVGVHLIGRGDVQQFRLQLPECIATKDIAADSKVQLEMRRDEFNKVVEVGTVAAWRAAFETGRAKATGVQQYLQLITQVTERHEERTRLRKARH